MPEVPLELDLAAVVTRFRAALRGFIRQRVPNETVADDLTQEVWVRLSRKLGTLRDLSKLEPWLYQVARHVVTDFYRRRRAVEEELPEEIEAAPADDGDVEALRRELRDYIRNLIHSLPEPHREALVLTQYEGLSQVELAERLGLSVTAAKSRVQRARAEVRRAMERCCDFDFDKYGNVVDYQPRETCECPPSGPGQITG